MSFSPQIYFNLNDFEYRSIFDGVTHAWEALALVAQAIDTLARPRFGSEPIQGVVSPGAWIEGEVYIAPGAVIEPGAYVQGPTVIGAGTVVRHAAYIRGECIIGRGCIVGHATELKRSIMLDGSHAPHFNYVGDSILGRNVNLGAGTRLGNFKSDGTLIDVTDGSRRLPTGLRKLGAILGDGVMTGCNVVTSPGTLVGPGSIIYPNASLKGVYPAKSIIKLRQTLEIVAREDRHG